MDNYEYKIVSDLYQSRIIYDLYSSAYENLVLTLKIKMFDYYNIKIYETDILGRTTLSDKEIFGDEYEFLKKKILEFFSKEDFIILTFSDSNDDSIFIKIINRRRFFQACSLYKIHIMVSDKYTQCELGDENKEISPSEFIAIIRLPEKDLNLMISEQSQDIFSKWPKEIHNAYFSLLKSVKEELAELDDRYNSMYNALTPEMKLLFELGEFED